VNLSSPCYKTQESEVKGQVIRGRAGWEREAKSPPVSECVILSEAVFQAERRILRGVIGDARKIPRPAGESAGLRDDAAAPAVAMTYLYKDRNGQSVQFLPLNNL
jgi:hypothetical protein